MRLQHCTWRWLLKLGVGVGVLLSSTGAIAAERVVWRYQVLQRSVSVDELNTLAETGEVSPTLQTYLRLAGKNPQDVRQTLTQEATVNPRLLDQILNSPVGNVVIDQVSGAIHTPSRRADRQAMRAALVLSASDDSRISLIEVIRNYPTQEIHVDGDRLAVAYQEIQGLQNRLDNVLQRIGL
jgi:hypothetical protein